MTNVFKDKADELVKLQVEQNNQVCNEIDGSLDVLTHAAERLEVAEKLAKAKYDEADQILAAAKREYEAARANATTALISVRQQLAAGQMVTGSTATPQPRNTKAKPKLVGDEEAA